MAVFVLIHSPLVGPLTWKSVAEVLRKRGYDAVVPVLKSDESSEKPYWQQHVDTVVDAVKDAPSDQPLVLVAHSGAGMLLPAIGQALERPVQRYIFVDAGIPEGGKSRMELMGSPEEIENFRRSAKGGYLSPWNEADLRDTIPDEGLRRRFVDELHPLPQSMYEEPIPMFTGWPDAPVSYLRFGSNPAYDAAFQRAKDEGWQTMQIDGDHFHMLVDPEAVAQALIDLSGEPKKKQSGSPESHRH